MSECYAGHEVLNHLGAKICVSRRTLRMLDMRHYLRRDRPTGLLQIKPYLYPAYLELEGGDHCSRIFRELGPDCSGAAAVICSCRDCQQRVSDIDHTLTPIQEIQRTTELTAKVLREVRAKRRRR